jgi:hypothetical protein
MVLHVYHPLPALACQVCTTLGEELFEGDGPFDLVTVMFALHYFYESEMMLRMLMKNVSYNLKPGGCRVTSQPVVACRHNMLQSAC